MAGLFTWLPVPDWLDLVDIALVAAASLLVIRFLRQTRAWTALLGLALLAVVYLFARGLELRLAAALFQGFFAVVVLIVVVVFQDDLRRLFEQLGSWRGGGAGEPGHAQTLDLLVRSVTRLASQRTGALIVLPGREPLDRHIEGGVALGGRVSEPLLLSLFDSSSPGHDGAVILRGGRLERFAVHLPLSANHAALGPGGTRHAAALGLSERCDALCIAVSEERGTVSVAHQGEMRRLARPQDLALELRETLGGSAEERRPWWHAIGALDAALAIAAALAMWMVFVPGSDVGELEIRTRVAVANLPDDMELEFAEPSEVLVTLRGLRRDLLIAQQRNVVVRLDGFLAGLGRRTFTLTPSDVEHPANLTVVAIEPRKLRLWLKADPEPPDGDGP